ncbi:MAG: Bug family tripartite tricarboxylate transporter substrate binding protein [Lautropia sp.]
MKEMLRRYKVVSMLMVLALFPSLGSAAEYPVKPIEWYSPYGTGGPAALAMKLIMDTASKSLGQPSVMVNAPGAGGTIASARVARAKPDGYSLVMAASGNHGIAMYTVKDLSYTNDDFEFIAQFGVLEVALFVGPHTPFKTLAEFVDHAKKNPHALKFTTTGVGSGPNLILEALKMQAGGLQIDPVVFKTSPEQRTTVLGGHTHASVVYGGSGGPGDNISQAIAGGGRMLAVTAEKRLEAFPQIPTFAEQGYDISYRGWYGIASPKGMPKEVSKKLKDAIYKAMEDPEVIKGVKALGFIYAPLHAEEFLKVVKAFEAEVKVVAEKAKIPRE